MRISDKRTMYAMLARGEFGNFNPMWFTLSDWLIDNRGKMFPPRGWGIRAMVPGGVFKPNVACCRVSKAIESYPQDGYIISPMIPDEWLTMNAELVDDCLTFSTVPKPMRQSLAEGARHVERTNARMLMRHFLDPASLDNIYDLQERYPGAAIEFTTLDRNYGPLGLNAVVWEVRHY